MPTSYRIFKDRRLVIITTSGESSVDETIQSLEQLFADPEYVMEYDLLWDHTGRTTVFTHGDILEIMKHFKYYTGDKHPKRAIVVSQADYPEMTRISDTMASISSRARIGLFPDIAEARRWLEQ